jgi:hypothetical protein
MPEDNEPEGQPEGAPVDLAAQLEAAEAALSAVEHPLEGQEPGSARDIDLAAQKVLDLRAAIEGEG